MFSGALYRNGWTGDRASACGDYLREPRVDRFEPVKWKFRIGVLFDEVFYLNVEINDDHLPEVQRPTVLPVTLSKFQQDIVKRLEKAYEKNRGYYNLRRRYVNFKSGDIVYRATHVQSNAANYFSMKLAPKYEGPFEVISKDGMQGYLLRDKNGKTEGPWHIKCLRPPNRLASTRCQLSSVCVGVLFTGCFSLACRRHAESGLKHESHEGLGALTAPPSQSGHGPGQGEGCDAASPHHLAFGL
ncbi:Acetaldehyde dehydrogenase 2 [Frankliniella fusca]|uniref:Acetaldehyde dehydrogenase 2 n=1 Tax=Frankliniella fusca TaxID=407009 RepID=A0AAE1HE19_9NEOP|nr:Acetaldehyde dehydrogenase 2 [Frankliniella fusca]